MENLSSMQIKTTFVNKTDIDNLLYTFKAKMNFDLSTCENQTSKNKMAKSYRQKLFTKLNLIFRRQIILNVEEAIKFYSENEETLNERVETFFDMIQFINDDLDMDFIPDRLFVCAYLRVSAETYETMLNDPRADISSNLRNQMKNLEEFVISMTTNGLEQGLVNGYAWKKMQLKAEYGGNEIKSVETQFNKNNSILMVTGDDVRKKMTTNYNFPELLDNKKEENN